MNGRANSDPTIRRNNATGIDATDQALIIDPGAQSVDAHKTQARFDQGSYRGTNVFLGELHWEQNTGRLLVLGGLGRSESVSGTPIQGFAENDSWFDDVSDGPVTAAVVLGNGDTPPVKPSWVIVAPPDFAPGIANLVTLYDTLYALAVDRGLAGKGIPALPSPPSYPRHVLPILQRVLAYAWVNRFARKNHGPGGVGDFTSPDWAGIEDPTQAQDLRQDIVGLLRDPRAGAASTATKFMPRLFSDDYPTRTVLPLTKVQYDILIRWAANDFDPAAGVPPPEQLPDALTRVALEACVGGAFWPGIEAGRILRDAARYLPGEPFRLALDRVRPGELTGSMALPWQADFFDCAWEGTTQKDLGWWPAQRPDDVLVKATATSATDMVPWMQRIDSPDDLVKLWHLLGVVVNQGTSAAPLFLETERDPSIAHP